MFTSLSLLSVSLALASAAFCPREKKDGLECRSQENQYKCAIFYDHLAGPNSRALTWIAALPDALEGKDQEVIDEILGKDITPASFENKATCDGKAANAFCYTLLQKLQSTPLDKCDRNLVNTKKANTLGNQLCDQAIRFLKQTDRWPEIEANGLRNQQLSFQYSACKSEWTPVSSNDQPLLLEEPLCCNVDGTFVRCDGSDYTKTC